MPNVRRLVLGAAIALPVLLSACGRGDHDIKVSLNKRGGADPDAKFVKRDSTRVLGPNDVQIVSTDSAVEFAIIGDSMVTGFGKKVRDEIAEKTDTSTVGTGFAAGIEKMVKSSVADALGHQLVFPVSEVGDVKAEGGGLQFYAKDGSKMHMFENDNHGKKTPLKFSDTDAQRFIAAFKTRKAGGA